MDFLASPAALFLFVAFSALGYVTQELLPNSNRINAVEVSASSVFCDLPPVLEGGDRITDENCLPCPGTRCRQGRLVQCPYGHILRSFRCEEDILFRSKIDILKQDLHRDVFEDRQTKLEDIRRRRRDFDPKLFDLALEQYLQENNLQVVNGEIEGGMASTEAGGPSSTAVLMFLVFILMVIFAKRREKEQLRLEHERRQHPPAYVVEPHLQRAAPAAEVVPPPPLPAQVVVAPPDSATPHAAGDAQSPPQCVICGDGIATEALMCGHLVSCSECLPQYKRHMQTTGNYTCPVCRKHSNGVWVHIYGVQ